MQLNNGPCQQQGRAAFEGHKDDQEQIQSVHGRTRDEVRGSRSPDRADGGAVALRLVLMPCFLGLSDHASLASYRLDSSVRVVRYGRWDSSVRVVICGRAIRAVKEVVAKSRRNPDEFALHSLRIGGETALTAGGETFRNE